MTEDVYFKFEERRIQMLRTGKTQVDQVYDFISLDIHEFVHMVLEEILFLEISK
jgi:hypothetical protein